MKPTVQAILLADRVYRDLSGKFIIAGVFNAMSFAQRIKPAADSPTVEAGVATKGQTIVSAREIQDVGNPWVYLSLTNVKEFNECKRGDSARA